MIKKRIALLLSERVLGGPVEPVPRKTLGKFWTKSSCAS